MGKKDVQIPLSRNVSFEVFRYQLVVDKTMQTNAFKTYETPEQLRADKNNIFKDIITNDKFNFRSKNTNLKSKLLYQKDDMFYFKISTKRTAHIYHEDFTDTKHDTYPNIIVAINNNPSVQKIAIQKTSSPFHDIETVRNIILESVDTKIKNYNLSFYVEPIFDKQNFWQFVRKHPQQIKSLSFDFITPNISNISKDLTIDLKQGYEDTNMHRSKFEMFAKEDGVLAINENSKFVNGIVGYTSQGGGSIIARLKNSRSKFNTADNPSLFDVEDNLIKTNNWEELDKQFKDILL